MNYLEIAKQMSLVQASQYRGYPMRQITEEEVAELSSVLREAEGRLHRLIEEGDYSANDLREHQRLVRAISQLEHPSYGPDLVKALARAAE